MNESQEANVNEQYKMIWDTWADLGYEKVALVKVTQIMYNSTYLALQPAEGGVVLDGGCGTGANFVEILKRTKAAKLIGADFSESMLKKAEAHRQQLSEEMKNKIELSIMDLAKPYKFEDNHFDAVVYHLSINYLPNRGWQHAIKETFRVLKPGGKMYITTQIRGYSMSGAYKKEFLKIMISNPRLFLMLLKTKKVANKIDEMIDKGVITYPSEEDLLKICNEVGFSKTEVVNKVHGGAIITLRAEK